MYQRRLSQRLPIITVEVIGPGSRPASTLGSRPLAAILRSLAEQLRLEGEDVIEDAVDPPALEAVVGDHARALELRAQQRPQRSVDTRPPALHERLAAGALAPVLRSLAQQLRLQSEDVIEDSIDAPPLEAVVGNDTGTLELCAQRRPQRSIDARTAAHLRFLEQLEAAVERELSQPVLAKAHVPRTSTLPASVTLTLTRSRCGSV